MMPGVHRRAIPTGTKKSPLARELQYAGCPSDSMTSPVQHQHCRAGSHFMVGCQEQRGVAMRPVAISVWNKKTGTGFQI